MILLVYFKTPRESPKVLTATIATPKVSTGGLVDASDISQPLVANNPKAENSEAALSKSDPPKPAR